jgi:hypothetical protein
VIKQSWKEGAIANAEAADKEKGWLTRMAEGNQADFRSPLFSEVTLENGKRKLKYPPREEIVAMLDFRVKAINVSDRYFLDLLGVLEYSNREKIGPQSPHHGYMRDGPKKVLAVYSDKPKKDILNEDALIHAGERVVALIQARSLEMSDIDSAMSGRLGHASDEFAVDGEGMDVHTNSGPPHFSNPWKLTSGVVGEKVAAARASEQYIRNRVAEVVSEMRRSRIPTWLAIVSQRLVSGGPNWREAPKKKRIVIALEKSEPVIWKMFTPQLQDDLKDVTYGPLKLHPFIAWRGLPYIDITMQKMLSHATRNNRTVLSGDLSNYDASIPPWLIAWMGQLMSPWFRSEGDGRLIRALTEALAYRVKLITPNKIWQPQPSSMKSGSGGTNLLDSLILILVLFYGEEIGLYKIDHLCVQGDDFVVDGNGINPESVREAFSHFGMEAHPDKQLFKPHALNFLQKLHYEGYLGGIASVYRILNSALNYERLKYGSEEWNGWVDVVRWLSQLENAVFSPYFQAATDLVRMGDRFQLGADISPEEIISRSGKVGEEIYRQDVAASWKSGREENGFTNMAVNGELRGKKLPSLGSKERFLRAYGGHAITALNEIQLSLKDRAA